MGSSRICDRASGSPSGVVPELVQAAAFDHATLAALVTAVYRDYWFPVVLDDAGFRRMVETSGIELELSRVAVVDDEPVGVTLVARRAREGWIGGMGVASERRRRGLGRAMLTSALAATREAGIDRVRLEVLEQNEPARALYAELGFGHERDLEVWTLPGLPDDAPPSPTVGLDDALAWVVAHRATAEPWQRADETTSRLRALGEALELVVVGDADPRAIAVVRRHDRRVAVQHAAATDAPAATELVALVRAGADSVFWLNLPIDDPVQEAVAALGGEPAARQLELALDL